MGLGVDPPLVPRCANMARTHRVAGVWFMLFPTTYTHTPGLWEVLRGLLRIVSIFRVLISPQDRQQLVGHNHMQADGFSLISPAN